MVKRELKRVVVDLEVDAPVGDMRCRASVYDLSCDGCVIEVHDGQVDTGNRIILNFPSLLRVAGRLIWCIGRNAGVRFDQPLHKRTVEDAGFPPDLPHPDAPWLCDRFGRPMSKRRGRKASSLKL